MEFNMLIGTAKYIVTLSCCSEGRDTEWQEGLEPKNAFMAVLGLLHLAVGNRTEALSHCRLILAMVRRMDIFNKERQ